MYIAVWQADFKTDRGAPCLGWVVLSNDTLSLLEAAWLFMIL